MVYCYAWLKRCPLLCLFLFALLLPGVAGAQAPAGQAPAWAGVTPGSLTQPNGESTVQATTLDASGNLLVAGYFSGTVDFGSTQLVSAGASRDFFLGKWLPASGTWAWVQRGGGLGDDVAYSVAVSGNNIYVAGTMTNNTTNGYAVSFGAGNVQYGIARGYNGTGGLLGGSFDMVLVKYVDNGTSAAVAWSQAAGGIADDQAFGVAVSGSSVYLTGYIFNSQTDYYSVAFGGSGATLGTATQAGASTTTSNDLVLAKYTDNGSSATFRWSQVGGGTRDDQGNSVAVSGTSIYVAGTLSNTAANAQKVLFGGSGTTVGAAAQYGASGTTAVDQVLAKYTDNGATGTLRWTQVAGGSGADYANQVQVSGGSVYVVGSIQNDRANSNGVTLGGSGTTYGTVAQYGASATASADLLLTKYLDNGATASLAWSQVGGGTDADSGLSLALSGNTVYVSGYVSNSLTNTKAVVFGGTRTTAGTASQAGVNAAASADILVACYVDNGTTAAFNWSQVGGGDTADSGLGLAVSGSTVYVAGYLASNRLATFGTAAGSPIVGTNVRRAMLGQLSTQASGATWQAVTATGNGGTSYIKAVAADAAGNLFVTGIFYGQVAFGSTVLSCASDGDLFVAKYVPSTGTWAWAQSGGGTAIDGGNGIAVSGHNVYVVGSISNTTTDVRQVRFGGTDPTTHTAVQYGASPTTTSYGTANDIVVAKYLDNGPSATFAWSQVAGGTDNDYGYGIAASGNAVYVTGTINNNLSNANAVLVGGSGPTAGTVVQYGASPAVSEDLLLVKYLDNGATASLAWSQVGGGTSYDGGAAVAVSGANVYVTGYLTNGTNNSAQVLFGGSGLTAGTAPQYGVVPGNTQTLVVAKYVDQGSSASLGWTQVGGSGNTSHGQGIVAVGSQVYVTGFITANNTGLNATFGGSGTTPGTVQQAGTSTAYDHDLVVAKYLDNGPTATVAWTQVGGGLGADQGNAIAVQGSAVYVTGLLNNSSTNGNQVVFGGSGTTPGTVAQPGAGPYASDDVVVAKYVDQGSGAALAWTQVAGGADTGIDMGTGIAATGTGLYVVGYAKAPATFGSFTLAGPVFNTFGFLGRFGATALPVLAAAAAPGLSLYPNPAPGAAQLCGATPGAAVQVLDALGRRVATTQADATGTAHLPAGLHPGVYVVRTGSSALRLTVE